MRKRNQGANVQYKDPFAPAMEAAQNTNQWLQKSQAEDIAKAQFAEGMQLNRDKFGEQQSQNAFSQEMQNKRYGLAAAANSRAALASARAGKAPSWYEKQRQLHEWGLEDITAKGKNTKSGKYGSSVPDDILKGMDEGSRLQVLNKEAELYDAGFSKADVNKATLGMIGDTSAFNILNQNDYSIKKNWIY